MRAAKLLILAVAACAVVGAPCTARAQSSSSASFIVTGQTLNNGLGSSTSPSYMVDSCLGMGPAVVGAATSTSFKVLAGCIAALQQDVCGNGVLEGNEECDDGNMADGDCCSSTCQFETTECRPSGGECDAAEICTGSSFPCPADVPAPAGAPCTPDANPCTLDQCDGTVSPCMHLPDNDNPACQPTLPGQPKPGDTTVTGRGNPGCTGGKITVFDCGPDQVCFNGDDMMLGMGMKNPNGTFMITVPPLQLGQIIYIEDSCTTPPLRSEPVLVNTAAPAPLLSPWGVAMAMAMLLAAGGLGLLRLRRSFD